MSELNYIWKRILLRMDFRQYGFMSFVSTYFWSLVLIGAMAVAFIWFK